MSKLSSQADDHVFLAQGIGIAPFRSMLVHAHSASLPLTTTLIHVYDKEHGFRELAENYARHAFHPTSSEEFRALVALQNINQQFYISGSPRFISMTRELLLHQSVTPEHIRIDSFLEY